MAAELDVVSVEQAEAVGLSDLLADVERGGQGRMLVRDGRPVAVLIGITEFDRLVQLNEDGPLIVAACARLLTDPGDWVELQDLANELNVDLGADDADSSSGLST